MIHICRTCRFWHYLDGKHDLANFVLGECRGALPIEENLIVDRPGLTRIKDSTVKMFTKNKEDSVMLTHPTFHCDNYLRGAKFGEQCNRIKDEHVPGPARYRAMRNTARKRAKSQSSRPA